MTVLAPPPAVPASPTQDTANLKQTLATALLANDEVVLAPTPGGPYLLNETLVMGGTPGITGVSLRGAGKLATRLCWTGSVDGNALFVDLNKGFRLSDLTIFQNVHSAALGLRFGRSGGPWNGTMAGNCRVENVSVDNFGVGASAGDANAAASEIVFAGFSASRCDVGVLATNYNTLNLRFEMLLLSNCGYGLKALQAGSIAVDGGSAAGNTIADFYVESGGTYEIGGAFRSENQKRFLILNATSVAMTSVVLNGCSAYGPTDPDRWQVELRGAFALTALGCIFPGRIGVKNAVHGNSLALTNCGIGDAGAFAPLGGTLDQVCYSLHSCKQLDAAAYIVGPIPNDEGHGTAANQRVSDWGRA